MQTEVRHNKDEIAMSLAQMRGSRQREVMQLPQRKAEQVSLCCVKLPQTLLLMVMLNSAYSHGPSSSTFSLREKGKKFSVMMS